MSDRMSASSRNCSGAEYAGVPTNTPVVVTPGAPASRAMPKSSTFTDLSGVMMMLSGLMSRWTISRVSASPSASATCAAIASACNGSSRPCRSTSLSFAPSTNSDTMK